MQHLFARHALQLEKGRVEKKGGGKVSLKQQAIQFRASGGDT